jgi:uncharacterized membrane-anchored protein
MSNPRNNCNKVGCKLLGTKCNPDTGKCEGTGTPDTNVCLTQSRFSNAFYKALVDSRKNDSKMMSYTVSVYFFIHLMFLVFGIMLAFRSQPKANRVVHITLAIVFGPAYVLAYYLNTL